jgi:tRNA A-37 threonylcarbamoyl transferase component Bud32
LNREIPPQFEKVVIGRTTILVKDKYRDPILSQKDAFSGKIKERELFPGVSLLKGRNVIPCIPIKGSKERMIIKHYEHGGLFRKITKDILWGSSRPFRELVILETASQRGIPVPEVLAARVDKILGPFYKGEIAYKEIPDSTNLLEYLKGLNRRTTEEKTYLKRQIINSLAEAIRKMHASGIYHADLNIKNVLVRNTGKGIQLYLLDFDCSRIMKNVSLRARIKNLARLNRSCEKWKAQVTDRDKLRFFLSYFRGNRLVEANLRKYVRRCAHFHLVHRIYWKFFG